MRRRYGLEMWWCAAPLPSADAVECAAPLWSGDVVECAAPHPAVGAAEGSEASIELFKAAA